MNHKLITLLTGILFLVCCGKKNVTREPANTVGQETKNTVAAPEFNADSAYHFIARQVAFGARIPNTAPHKMCADYLVKELERFGAKTTVQETVVTAYDGTKLNARNIIGSYHSDSKRRILLFAHWDSRPYADQDKEKANHNKPIDGADDGASGVGVLLEMARQINGNQTDTGIDIIFFDAEDYGTHASRRDISLDTWCLGSQFWSKNPHISNYKADFGILFDMVGAKGATFYKEYTSIRYASRYVELVWTTARDLGYGKYFINARGGGVVDDHQYVIEGRKIPCIDIINYSPDNENGFGDHWHTLDDNMNIIDKATLKAVGQTALEVIYKYGNK